MNELTASFKSDIVVLNETWLDESVYNKTLLKDFVIYRKDRVGRKGGGVLIAVLNTLKSSIIEETNESELELIAVEVKYKQYRMAIITLYRPPDLTNWFDQFDRILSSIREKYDEVLFAGDLNVNLLVDSADKNTLLDSFSSNMLSSVMQDPTRGSNLLDVVFFQDDERIRATVVDNLKPSCDHRAILIEITTTEGNMPTPLNTKSCKDYANANWVAIKKAIVEFNWAGLEADSIDKYFKQFENVLAEIVNISVPSILVKYRVGQLSYSRDLRKLLIKQRKLRKRSLVLLSDDILLKLNAISNEIEILQIQLEDEHIIRTARKHANIYELYKDIKQIRASSSPSSLRNTDGVMLYDDVEIADTFNKFFGETFNQPIDLIDNQLSLLQEDYVASDKSLHDFYVTATEMASILTLFKDGKSAGSSTVKNKVIKVCAMELIDPFLILFEKIAEFRQCPKAFKVADVTPLLKYSKPINLITSYRAISVTINFNKIYENILLLRIQDQILRNIITNSCQYGFVPGSSCVFQLIDLIYYVTTSFNGKDCKFVDVVFFDYKDAFNKVDHTLILRHLSSIGIKGQTLELFQDYYKNRKQRVKFNDQFSAETYVTSGITQGGIISPTIFGLVVRFLCRFVEHSLCLQFADDTTIVKSIATQDDVIKCQ